MTDIIEAYANNKAKEVAEKAAKKMLADGMSLEAVVRYSDLSEEEVRALAALSRALNNTWQQKNDKMWQSC